MCGPVTDIELQMKSKYGDDMTFIHQEVYVDDEVTKGLRDPLKKFSLPFGPWLFVVNKSGEDHRAAGGLDRRHSGSRPPSSPACEARARRSHDGARRQCAWFQAAAAAHGLSQRQQLPIPQWLFAWAAAAVLVVSFFALAVLWPEPRLERDNWRALPGGRGFARLPMQVLWGAIGCFCWA